jgi:uncharacterized protein (TIGR01244 family)
MKLSLLITLGLIFCFETQAFEHQVADSVYLVDSLENVYSSGDFYISGQPTFEDMKWMKNNGITTIINLRSEKEMKKFDKTAYNEKQVSNDLGLNYIHIPISGREFYTNENLKSFISTIEESEGKVLIHCGGAYRATYFMMAYLIVKHNYTVEDAIKFGEQITYFSYLESLLGEDIKMNL